jgi:peptidoglycan/xylan/chitin deacetylase (PgdA/CDA1 family)
MGTRREFIRTVGATLLAGGISNYAHATTKPKHIITLAFDDGFKKSSLKTAEIFEKYKLSASINVIATGHLKDFVVPDQYQTTEKGDFVLWNELQSRGHEIQPHGYKHANKAQLPLSEAQKLVEMCLDYFSKNLKGFKPEKSVFNMPYNSSTPELEAWLGTKVRAYRTGGPGINTMPHKDQKKLTCTAFGPGNCEAHLDEQIKSLLAQPSGWLIYNLHGVDDEGWGPVTSVYLERLLRKLEENEAVSVLPIALAFKSFAP